jgi:hypothetical protein
MEQLFAHVRRRVLLAALFAVLTTSLKAQLPDLGVVKLTIAAANIDKSGAVPFGDFEFSANTGSNQGFQWSDDKEYIDCSFTADVAKGGKSYTISGSLRVWHPKAGKFLLRKGADGDDPPNLATFHLNIDNSITLAGQEAGTGGTVVIGSFASGSAAGSFDVTLGDSPIPNQVKHLYKLTGTFRLKNGQSF